MSVEEISKELDVKNYFGPHLYFLRWLGIPIIPLDDFTFTRKIMYYIYSSFIIIFFPYTFFVTEGLDLFMNSFNDIDKLTFVLSYFVTHIMGFGKITLLLWSRKNIWDYCQILESGEFKPDFKRGGLKEFKIIKSAINHVNFQAIFFHVFVVLVISNRLLYAAFDKGVHVDIYDATKNGTYTKHIRTLPFLTWFPFDRNISPYYELAFAYQIWTTTIYGFYIGTADALITGFMIHIKSQYLILKNTLNNYVEQAEKMLEQNEPDIKQKLENNKNKATKIRLPEGIETVPQISKPAQKYAKQIINRCVYHHQQILILCDKTEAEFNLLMLLQFLGSLLLLCFQLFQLSLSNPKTFRFISMTFYLILMLFQLLLYCWNGNEVQLESGSLSDAIYHSNWMVADEPTKKAMLLMMMRAQRPNKLTAGKFAFLSVSTYTSILRGSASYFMVLRQMNN